MSVCIVKPSQYWDKNEANCIEIISDLNHPNPETNKHCRIQGGLWNETHFVFNRITHRVSIWKSRDVMFSWYLIVTIALLTYLHSLSSTSVQTTGMIKNGEFLLILRLKWKLAKRTLKKPPKHDLRKHCGLSASFIYTFFSLKCSYLLHSSNMDVN